MALQSFSLYLFQIKRKYDFLACFLVGFGCVASGWPFAGAAFCSSWNTLLLLEWCVFHCIRHYSGVSIALLLSYLVDGFYFGKDFAIPSANIVIYNVLSSDRGPDLYVCVCIITFIRKYSYPSIELGTVWNLGVSISQIFS